MFNIFFLLGVFALQVFLESLIRWPIGDPFLALGLYLSLGKKGWRRLGLLIFLGLWEGYFRGTGLLAGLFSALAVVWLQGLLEKRLDLSLPWCLLGVLMTSLIVFWFLLLVLFPYLLEKGPPALWMGLFLFQIFITGVEMVLILFWEKRFSLEQVLTTKVFEK